MLLIFIAGVFAFFARSPDAVLSPILYTEDALWLGIAIEDGWAFTFMEAKAQYFVWGNLLLLWLASSASSLVCGSALRCAPEMIALTSYAYY